MTPPCFWRPDNQTWISSMDGKEHPVEKPALYGFSDRWLAKVTP